MKKVLVTGGAGFIGSHLIEELNNANVQVVVYDNLTTGSLNNIKGLSYSFVEADILNKDKLIESLKGCEEIYHLAAATSVIESMSNPEKYNQINTLGTINILQAALECGVKKVVMASSAAVYGDSPQLPKHEGLTPDPQSPYAVSKLDGEYYCRIFDNSQGLQTSCARFFNVFGERQDPQSAYAAAIPVFISKIMNNEPVQIFGDGEQTRDFIYVKDVVKALVFLMDNSRGVYNIGYGKTITVNSLVDLLCSITEKQGEKKYMPKRPGEIKHSYASVDKITKLGFSPAYTLEKGLEKTVEFWSK